MLQDPKTISYLNILQEQYVFCRIDKAANNIAFICKKYFLQVLLKELSLLNTVLSPYQQVNDTLHNVLQQQNNTLDFVFEGCTRDYIVINKQGCASWSSKKRGDHFGFTKSLLKEAITFLLHNCFFSIGNIMIQPIGIPTGSDPTPFFANFFLAHKKAGWVKAQQKLGTINVRKINNSFRFIDDLLSLNDDSTFEKHYKDIYSTELELNRENNSSSCASYLEICICIENGEFHTKLFGKRDSFAFDIVRMPFYCPNVPNKIFYGSTGVEFLRISIATSKTEDLFRTCTQLLSRMLKQNEQMKRIKFSLIKMFERHQEVFIKYNKSIEEVMQAIGF